MTTTGDVLAPSHIVIVGASDDPSNVGRRFVRALRIAGYSGAVSVIHPKADSVADYPVYRDFAALPSAPDHVIVAVAGSGVVSITRDAVNAGAKTIHLFAGGFAESADLAGAELQAELVAAIRDSNARLIGPNCMGIHRPSAGITFREDLPLRTGPLGIVSQSGGIAIAAIRLAELRRMGISTAITYGNGADFGAGDGLTLLADDPDTKVIAIYLESANDENMLVALRYAARRKPVVVWSCAAEPAAVGASRFHTGAPGGILNRSDIPGRCIVVDRLSDLVDVPAALLGNGQWPTNPRFAFASISGGFGVAFTELATRLGFMVPQLEPTTSQHLLEIYGTEAANLSNPIDLGGSGFLSRGRLNPLFQTLAADSECNVIVFHLGWDFVAEVNSRVPRYGTEYVRTLIGAINSSKKLVVVYCPALDLSPDEIAAREQLRDAHCLVLEDAESILRVAQAISASTRSV
jgi:acetyltransferase